MTMASPKTPSAAGVRRTIADAAESADHLGDLERAHRIAMTRQ
jgi:hypothetical protein